MTEQEARGKSQANPKQAAAGLALCQMILADRSLRGNISARDIMIVAPYMAQCEEYVGQLELMGKTAGLADIRVRTVDGVQGGEAPVVILDMTITDRLGFLTKPNRLNVALSRGKSALYVLVNRQSILSLLGIDPGDYTTCIREVMEYAKNYDYFQSNAKLSCAASSYGY